MRIAAYKGTSALSRAIRWASRGPYSHIAFLLDDGSVIEAWIGGVRHVQSLAAQHTPGTSVDIFRFNPALTVAQARELHRLAQAFVDKGVGYDYWMLPMFLSIPFLKRDRKPVWDRSKVFCSELVFALCEKIDAPLALRGKAFEFTPTDDTRSLRLAFDYSTVTV